jgi:hypothetical protein
MTHERSKQKPFLQLGIIVPVGGGKASEKQLLEVALKGVDNCLWVWHCLRTLPAVP